MNDWRYPIDLEKLREALSIEPYELDALARVVKAARAYLGESRAESILYPGPRDARFLEELKQAVEPFDLDDTP